MALPLIGALAGLGRLAVGAGRAATGTTARRVGYGAALGDLATDAVVGAGKGLVGGLKGAMISEAPGLAGAYAFGKDLRKRANASRGNASSPPPPSSNKSSSSTPVIGGLGSLNTASILVSQKQSNIINLEQVRQLKQLNDSVINQSKLISYQIDDTRRKNQFTEEAANEQAIRDDKLLEAIRNIGSGGGGGKRGGGEAANDSSSGGFLSSLLGGAAGGAMSKLVPLLTGAMAALPWAKILKLAGPASLAVNTLSLRGSTPDPRSAKTQSDFYVDYETKKAQQRAAEEAKDAPRPSNFVPVGNNPNSMFNQTGKRNTEIKQEDWDKKYKGRKDPATGKTIPGIYNMPVSASVSSVYTEDDDPTTKRKSTTPGMSTDHKGVDFNSPVGSPIFSIAPGKVKSLEKTGSKLGLGRFVEIDHGNGVISKYGHLSEVSVSAGQEVGPGILLGKSGGDPSDSGSGISTGAHLHLETTNHGVSINPAKLAGLAILKNKGAGVELSSAAGLPPAVTSPAAGNSPASTAPAQSSAPTGGKKSNIIQSNTGSNAGPLGEFYRQNAANINVIKERDDAIADSKSIKTKLISSLSKKSLDELTVLRKQVEYPRTSGGGETIILTASDKSEVLKAIDEEIKKKTVPAVVPKTSSSAYDQILAAFSAPFDKSKYDAGVQYASLDTGIRSDAGGGGGSNYKVTEKAVLVRAPDVVEAINTNTMAQGFSPSGRQLATNVAYQGKQLNTTVEKFKPLFRDNSEILEDANKAFLKELRSTFTSIFNTGLTEALLPNGAGVSASQAGRDDMYRGEQLKQINDTSKKISEGAVKLFGPKFGPMFGPLIDRMSTSYLEVGSRMAGKAIFQKIGGLDANDTMTLTGQVLGNYASGKKELAFEQLLYGASGGKNGGIALGTETLFAKYGFKDPMEGISYFANALGEKATQPFAKMMGSDDRSKSIIWNPRAGDKGTGAFVYADNGRLASDADIKASGNYGASMSQTSISPGMNNFGMPFDPYRTTAGVNGSYKYNGAGSQLQQMLESKPGTGPSRAQYFGLTEERQAAGGIELKARQDLQIAADIELANKARDHQQKLAEEGAKRQFDIASKQASNDQEQAAATAAFNKAMTSAQISSGTADTGAVIAKLDELKTGNSSGTVVKDKDGNPVVRQPGQLFSQSIGKDGKVINDPMKEIGNFGFDMLKNYAGQQLTKDIKNPYAQMVANFAIQKGLNYGVDALLGKTGETGLLEKGISYVADNAPSWIEKGISWYSGSARGGPITGPGSVTSDSIPTMLSNGEFVINAKATKENMALLTAINESGLTTGKSQGFNKGGPVKGGGTLSDKLSGFLSSIGVTGEGLAAYEAKQSSQVVSSSGVYNGFPMARGPDGTMVVDKPGYYDAGKSIASFGKNVSNFGGLLGGLIPGKTAVGVAAQLIGGLMTAPFDRQSDFWGDMDAGTGGKAGAVSIGNGNYAMMDGNVFDRSGTLIGGTVVDGSGRAVTTGSGGTLGFGVGPNYSAQIASNMSSISESSQNSMAGSDVGPSPGAAGVPFASGGNVTGPGSGTSDSIPAMLSNGEFVVNALATKKYRPLLDAINALDVKHLEGGTASASGESVATLSKVLGTNETNSQLAISNETLTSIDGSLRTISGRPTTGSGTAVTGTGSGLSFDTGLGAFGGPASGGLGGNQVMGTANGRGGRSAPSTMDIIGNVAANVAKGYLVKAGITAVTGGMMGSLGAVLPSMYGAYSFAGGGMAGIAAAAESGIALTSMAVAEGAAAIGSALSSAGTFLMTNPVGWVILGGLVLFSMYGGGGRSSPPPKQPKFHAAMYVSGNNNPNAIAPIHETTDYHAVPDNYKTIAYGLLRVAFNATKASEAVTKIPSPWDWLYMKIQFDRMSLIWGKGAPPKESLLADTYPENMSWPAPAAGMNLNTVASDIIDRITKEFKTNLAAADANLAKLDTAATGLKNYTLDELSSGLISELKSGKLKLDSTIQKGIYAADVNESNRIGALINAAAIKAAYITDSEGNPIVSDTIPAGGTNMVYSMKQGKFVKNPYGLDTILLDAQDRPVYNIEGTSAGLTIDDFVSAERAGARTANILAPPVTAGSAGGNGATVVNAPSVVTTDASSLEIYYTTQQTAIDALRAAQSQTG